MTLLFASAEVDLSDAGRFLKPICAHLAGHGHEIVALEADRAELRLGSSRGSMRALLNGMSLEVEASDLAGLLAMRASLAGHLAEFAGSETGPIVWTGDGSGETVPPEFREMEVLAVEDVTPIMRRVRLGGSDLGRYATSEHLHCKLLFAPDRSKPVWPRLGPDGTVCWADGEDRLELRKYTIRRIDVAAGHLDVDFVRHADAGIGSGFAERAQPGDRIGMIGPGGLGAKPAAWTLLAGDETALPAIARILEEMPADACGVALIEIADDAERQRLRLPPGVDLHWLSRYGAPAGSTSLLTDAVRAVEWPRDREDMFVWAGTEFAAFKQIRSHLRNELRLSPTLHHVVAYWRRDYSNL